VPPEKLLRALLLQALYTIRSERQLMEQLDCNTLFRWFVGLGMDDAVWSPTTFTKNRDHLLDGDIAAVFFQAVLLHADSERLLSDEAIKMETAIYSPCDTTIKDILVGPGSTVDACDLLLVLEG
jgi:transposase